MPLTGDITTFSLSAICRLIHAEKKTGMLHISSEDPAARVFFRNGEIIFVNGALTEELSLGGLLKSNNLVPDEAIEACLEIARGEGRRLGIVLIERGHISQKKLVKVLHYQFKEAITKMLTWQSGSYTYTDGLGDHQEDIYLEINPIRLVAEAEKWKEYRIAIPDDRAVFQIQESGKRPSITGDLALRVLLMLDGERTVSQIIAETGLPRTGVYKAITALLNSGVIFRKSAAGNAHADALSVVTFYLKMLQVAAGILAAELGRKKAFDAVDKSIRQHPWNSICFQEFRAEADIHENLHQIRQNMESRDCPEPNVLEEGFHQVILGLIREEYQILGYKSAQKTIRRLVAELKAVSKEERKLSQALSEFLQPYSDREESLLTVRTEPAQERREAAGPEKVPETAHQNGFPLLAMYLRIVQEMVWDLEREIGTKTWDLYQSVVAESGEDYELLSPVDIKESINDNMQRIQHHFCKKGGFAGSADAVRAFQNLLEALLWREQRLLGSKATRTTITNLEEKMDELIPERYRPFRPHLSAFLKTVKEKLDA